MKTGKIERNFGKLYNSAFDIRSESDYTDMVEFDVNKLNEMLQESELFIDRMQQLTMNKLSEEDEESTIF